ncbi:unnamed protein product, partial [Polarella glacialis]
DPVPTFCQGVNGVEDAPPLRSVVKHLALLKPAGEHALRRLLWVTALTSHCVEFCPFLPNLMATLLTFFSEAETMFMVSQLIQEAENEVNASRNANPRMILNLNQMHKQAKLLVTEGKNSGNCPEALEHMESLGMDVNQMALELLQDGLATVLPFRSFLRLVGAFMAEGSEVMLRFALAMLKIQTPAILSCSTSKEVKGVLASLGFSHGLDDRHKGVEQLTK